MPPATCSHRFSSWQTHQPRNHPWLSAAARPIARPSVRGELQTVIVESDRNQTRPRRRGRVGRDVGRCGYRRRSDRTATADFIYDFVTRTVSRQDKRAESAVLYRQFHSTVCRLFFSHSAVQISLFGYDAYESCVTSSSYVLTVFAVSDVAVSADDSICNKYEHFFYSHTTPPQLPKQCETPPMCIRQMHPANRQ